MKIRIEYEVPEDNCVSCGKSFWNATHRSLYCKEFKSVYLKRAINGKFNRCQACIDAEVKEKNMFDSVSIRHTGGEISVTKTVIEHRAPTDDSIRLYGEIKEKAYKSILETIELRDNPINLNAILYYEFESRRKVCKWQFTLNGKEYHGEMKSSRLDFLDKTKLLQEIFKHVSEVIAGQIMKVAIDGEGK